MRMCDVIAYPCTELLVLADGIGVETRRIQQPGTYCEHFDVCLSKRALAVAASAVEASMMCTGTILTPTFLTSGWGCSVMAFLCMIGWIPSGRCQ
ncbi:DUF4031 domain-containing protein [Vannielia litorea]|uniref:DUF4031 domain-containing protein n=1 Tax=Vannielia litorea TaxID=1217970 RepID=UPI00237A67C4|nr:DUF4031 domain-containing protein [Vannielia litorea]MBS8227108.1 DUF4031 domain-containing protein [Vannielia litorea]